jgi:hypothetical protein
LAHAADLSALLPVGKPNDRLCAAVLRGRRSRSFFYGYLTLAPGQSVAFVD